MNHFDLYHLSALMVGSGTSLLISAIRDESVADRKITGIAMLVSSFIVMMFAS